MLNHFRTLLLNAKAGVAGYPGEEFIPSDYRPVALPGAVNVVRGILFGAEPDRLMLNYRARQLLAAVQATELRGYLTAFDRRITYEPTGTPEFYEHPFALSVRQISGDALTIYPGGVPDTVPDVTGRSRHLWRIVFGSITSVTIRRLTAPFTEETYGFEVVDGLSTPIPLPGTGLYFTFHPVPGTIDWETLSVDEWLTLDEAHWTTFESVGGDGFVRNPVLSVSADVRPLRDPGQLLAQLDAVGEPTMLGLFGIGTPLGASEPMATFYRLWRDHKEPAYRFGAVAAALVYHTEHVRTGNV